MKIWMLSLTMLGALQMADLQGATKCPDRPVRAAKPPREKPQRVKPVREVKPKNPEVATVRPGREVVCNDEREQRGPYVRSGFDLTFFENGGCVYVDPRRPYFPPVVPLPPPPTATEAPVTIDGVSYDLTPDTLDDFDRWVAEIERAEQEQEAAQPQPNPPAPVVAEVKPATTAEALREQQRESDNRRIQELNERIRRFNDRLASGEVVPGGEEEKALNQFRDDSVREIERLQNVAGAK